jgi:hypothetical protein
MPPVKQYDDSDIHYTVLVEVKAHLVGCLDSNGSVCASKTECHGSSTRSFLKVLSAFSQLNRLADALGFGQWLLDHPPLGLTSTLIHLRISLIR